MKKTFLPFLALVIAVALSAFTAPKTAPHRDALYFEFTGDQATGSEYIISDNWTPSSSSGSGCTGANLPCVVDASNLSGVTDADSFAAYLDAQTDDGASFVTANTLSKRP